MFIDDIIYSKIVRMMPIPCVDLLITDNEGRILLVKRKNRPARGSWWFPGGRVNFNELRMHAAERKLKEECGLVSVTIVELETVDLILPLSGTTSVSHGITTLYLIFVDHKDVVLDSQSSAASWRSADQWLALVRQPFVRYVLNRFVQRKAISLSTSK